LTQTRTIHIARELANYYKFDYMYWLVILYCGHRYFQFRIFNFSIDEIEYRTFKMIPIPQQPLYSLRFLTCFKYDLLVSEVLF